MPKGGVITIGTASVDLREPPAGALTDLKPGRYVRLSVTAGYTLWERLQVYLSPKVFGGPIFRIPGMSSWKAVAEISLQP